MSTGAIYTAISRAVLSPCWNCTPGNVDEAMKNGRARGWAVWEGPELTSQRSKRSHGQLHTHNGFEANTRLPPPRDRREAGVTTGDCPR